MRIIISLLIMIIAVAFTQRSDGFPKATERAERWQLRLDTGDMRFYRDPQTQTGYWVLIYEVTNETDEDHRWIPQFDLVTDRGDILADGDDVPRDVQLRMLDMFGDPLLKSPSDASGPLLQGEENAIRGMTVWKVGNENVNEIQVFAGGVSGDTAEVIHPITGEVKKLHRVIQLSWFVDGSLDKIMLKPLPKRPAGTGTSVRRIDTTPDNRFGGVQVERKWIFR